MEFERNGHPQIANRMPEPNLGIGFRHAICNLGTLYITTLFLPKLQLTSQTPIYPAARDPIILLFCFLCVSAPLRLIFFKIGFNLL